MKDLKRKFPMRLLLPVLCLFVAAPLSVSAQSATQKLLLSKAQSLAAQGHLDIAVQTWQQILLSDPQSREALTGIARADMQLGKTLEAKGYLDRLRALGVKPADITKIQATVQAPSQQARLDQAGRLRQQGKYVDAMRIYREIFGSTPPAGNWALAYYDTEAQTPGGRKPAIAGLRQLSQQFSADPHYTITLGRILTYDPSTRAEGVSILQHYGDVAEAQAALKQVQSWHASPDATNQDRARTAPANPLEAAAYTALNSGRLEEAERQFTLVLKDQPQNAQALSGMGYVRMKQRNFSEAASYLEHARAAGAKEAGLREAIATSRFWEKMANGDVELKSGRMDTAIEAYRAAAVLKATSPEASEALAEALMKAGNPSQAAEVLGREVRFAPQRDAAWRNLFLAESESGDAAAALATSARMPESVRVRLQSDPDYLRSVLQTDQKAGRKAEATRVIEQVLALPFPNQGRDFPLDKQMSYAALLMTAQRYEPALSLYRQMVTADPESVDAWQGLIASLHQVGRDEDGLAALGRMPQSVSSKVQSNSGFLALAGSLYQVCQQPQQARKYLERALAVATTPQPAVELQLAGVYSSLGQQQKAFPIYQRQLERDANSLHAWSGMLAALHQANRDREALRQMTLMPDAVRERLQQTLPYMQLLASIQSTSGADMASLRTFDQLSGLYRERQREEPVNLQLQHGWLLLKAGEDKRLYALISSLAVVNDKTDAEQVEFSRLWASWSIRRAASARAAGDPRRAVAILEAAAQAFPGNAEVYDSLAGAYLGDGQPRRALAIYASLDMSKATLARYQGAIGAALAANSLNQAETWLAAALDQHKDDPTILKMAAQYEQARGDTRRAAQYYQASLDAMGPASPAEIFNTERERTPGAGRDNPHSPTQELMQLLVPNAGPAQTGEQAESSIEAKLDDLPSRAVRRVTGSVLGGTILDGSTLGDFVQFGREQDSASGAAARPYVADADTFEPLPAKQLPPLADAVGGDVAVGKVAGAKGRNSRGKVVTLAQHRVRGLRTTPAIPVSDAVVSDTVAVSEPNPQGIQRADDLSASGTTNPAGRLESAVRMLDGPPLVEPVAVRSPVSAGRLLESDRISPIATASPIAMDGTAEATLPPQRNFAALPSLRGSSSSSEVVRAVTPREQVQQQLAVIDAEASSWIGGTSGVDYRSGLPGYDHLAMYSAQMEMSSTVAPGVRATIVAKPVLLDAGEANGAQPAQQGTLPATLVPYRQSAAGIGGELQLQTSLFGVSVGYTPHGFLVENTTGSLYIHPPAAHFAFNFNRSPILDTQLSFAGLRDQGSKSATYKGNIWGGVMSNAGQVQIQHGDSVSGWYLQGGGQYLTGQHIPDNTRIDGDAGAYWAAWQSPQHGTLTVGMNFFGMHYQRNLRYFTYGQGGYFSPAAYMLGGMPLGFTGHYSPKFHYRVTGSLGVQAFQEDSAPYFPLDPTVQAAQKDPYFPERVSVGGNYNLESMGSYAIADKWYVGGYLNFNNSRDYASVKTGFFLRYMFRPQTVEGDVGPTGLFPVEGLRPVQVP